MWRKLLFFLTLYFVQGAALAYIVNFQKPYLVANGISKQTLGLFTSLLLIPFIAKVGLGIISDRWPIGKWGGRKPYMLIGLALFAGSYFSLQWVSPAETFFRFAAITWLASLGLAWFDTCADGWAVDIASDREQSYVQAAMIAGKSLGLISMSLTFGIVASDFGLPVIFRLLSGLALIAFVYVVLVPGPKRFQGPKSFATNWLDLWQPSFLFFAMFGIIYSIASFGTDGVLTLHLSEVHRGGAEDIGLFGMLRGGGALSGAVLYAAAKPYLGLKRAQVLALLLLAAGCLLPLAPLSWQISAGLWGIAWGFQETAFVTLAMRFSQGPLAASVFAVCMIFSNVGTAVGEALASPLIPTLGYQGVFLGFAGLALLALIFQPRIFKAI